VAELPEGQEEPKQKSPMQKSGEIIARLLDDGLHVTDSETGIEIDFALTKIKYTVKRKTDDKK
jgi:hypothetical protein